MRRTFGLLAALLPGAAAAEAWHDLGKPEQCGAYAEAAYDRETWFPGGEGGVVTLTDPQGVRGLNAVIYDGVISEEGFSEPAGRVLALRGPLNGAEGQIAGEVLVILTESGVRVLERCP